MVDVDRSPGVQSQSQGRFGATGTGSPKSVKKSVPDQSVMSNGVEDDNESQSQQYEDEQPEEHEEAETERAETEKAETEHADTEAGDAEGEAEGDEVVPIGSVDGEGHVVNAEGTIVGHADEKVPEGSLVDKEGDILDAEGNVIGKASDIASEAKSAAGEAIDPLSGRMEVQEGGELVNEAGVAIGHLSEGAREELPDRSIHGVDEEGNLKAESGSVIGKAQLDEEAIQKAKEAGENPEEGDAAQDLSVLKGKKVNKLGKIVDEDGTPIGQLVEGEAKKLVGYKVDEEGKIWNDSGKIIGRAELLPEDEREKPTSSAPFEDFPDSVIDGKGNVIFEGRIVGKVVEGDAKKLEGKKVDEDGDILDKNGNSLGKAERTQEEEPEPEAEPEAEDLSSLEGKKVNKAGNVVDDEGKLFGRITSGEISRLVGKKCDAEGKIWSDSGKVLGQAELIPKDERDEDSGAPFEDFPDATVDSKGNVIFEDKVIGKLIEGDAKKLSGKKVDKDGDILDKNGNTLGKAERWEEEEAPEAEKEDRSSLEGKKVNKAGNVVDDNGKLFGRITSGEISRLIGKKCDAEGKIWSDSGKVIGEAELIPADERDEDSGAPFEDFPDAVVDSKGNVNFEGQVVGKLIEGDAKKLAGKKVDKDGDILDKNGNTLGKAERWVEEEAPEAEKEDLSGLAGKRVNKLGNIVDGNGQIWGHLVEGDAKKLAGKMCNRNGEVVNEMGDVVGRAELVPEGEREGEKTGPFADFDSPTVTKDGKVADSKGAIIGRVISGDPKQLYGKPVDNDGDILDKNGNSLGKAERWEEEEKAVDKHPAAGRKVNKEGNVVDENGDVIAKLTDGQIGVCAGKEVDNDGDVVDGKGKALGHVTLIGEIEKHPAAGHKVNKEGNVVDDNGEIVAKLTEGEITKCVGKKVDNDGDVVDTKGKAIGHVTLIEDIPAEEPKAEEPTESEEDKKTREDAEKDKELAGRLSAVIDGSLDKINPILKMIKEAIDHAESQKKEDLDEQKLVDTVKPLLEEGGQILQECNGAIRALDPDGRIQAKAKSASASREATPEEYRLADKLKELSANVMTTIEQAKKKIAGMPHAKKELNPLWNLLAEPLGQIIAAVGLLLSGVLGLVGRLLSGLGLGGLLDNLLGGLGLKGILKGLGLGMVTESLTGKKN